jgi:hypothetical protein
MADDDDICCNAFFAAIRSTNRTLLNEAAAKGALVCVPKAGTCPSETIREQQHRSHVILQSPFFVGIYDSLDGRQVKFRAFPAMRGVACVSHACLSCL